MASGARTAPPVVSDLAAVAKRAQEQHVPVFVAFTLKQCPYCNRARREYWTPMHESAEWRAKTLMVEIVLDGEPALRDFNGNETTVRAFAQRYNIRSVPTVIVFDTQGVAASDPLVGLASADFYGAYLERDIAQGIAKVRESR
jgi:thioredoxin-related protein